MLSEKCEICPRSCRVDREKAVGYCKSGGKMRIARAALHNWEEPIISGENGSGAVFFTGCSLGCVYCQNNEISRETDCGKAVTPEELNEIFFELIGQGAHNINLVTPTHFAPLVKEALLVKKLPVPVVYNTSGYENVETLRSLEGLVDIYLPDFKYAEPELAAKLSSAEDYPEKATAAIKEMVRQVGAPVVNSGGIMTSGVLVRHLILPGHTKNSIKVLERLAEEFPDIPVSLMAQYTPPENLKCTDRFPELARTITKRELEKVQSKMFDLNMDGFVQARSAGSGKYLPDFHQFDSDAVKQNKEV